MVIDAENRNATESRRSSTFFHACVLARCLPNSVQKVSFRETSGHVLFSDVADVLTDKGFDFKLETVLEHQVDFLLPLFLTREPWVFGDLARALDVLVVQFD